MVLQCFLENVKSKQLQNNGGGVEAPPAPPVPTGLTISKKDAKITTDSSALNLTYFITIITKVALFKSIY